MRALRPRIYARLASARGGSRTTDAAVRHRPSLSARRCAGRARLVSVPIVRAASTTASEPRAATAGARVAVLDDDWLALRLHRPSSAGAATSLAVHHLWLRHQCEQDRHPRTKERVVDASELDPNVRPRRATVDDGTTLQVEWSDGRVSRYSLDWLAQHAYATTEDIPARPPSDAAAVSVAWSEISAPDASASDPVVVHHASRCDKLVRHLVTTLGRHGIAIVRGFQGVDGSVAPEDTEALIDAFGRQKLQVIGTHFGRIEDLRTDNTTNKNTDQLGYTDAAIHLHTDQPFIERPPRFQLLHCMRPAHVGGENFFVDARAAAEFLARTDADAFRHLSETPVRFHRKQAAFESIQDRPILGRNPVSGDFQVRYSYFTLAPFQRPFAAMGNWYRAYNAFARIVRDPRHQIRTRLDAGDFVVYDNHRMLHARTSFEGARWLRGVYFDSE